MKDFFKRLWNNKDFIFKSAKNFATGVFSVIGIIATFTPIENKLDLPYDILVIISILVVAFIYSIIHLVTTNYVEIHTTNKGNKIVVKYGNVLNCKSKNNDQIIAIPVNRCFDVIADDELIAKRTIHGQFIDMLIPNHYSAQQLNSFIQEYLFSKYSDKIELSKEEKYKGNLTRYKEGSIAEIKHNNTTYYLLGLSAFDSDLHAQTTFEEYMTAIDTLINYYIVHSQNRPIYIPLIGTGASNVNKNQNDILDYMISLLKLYQEKLNGNVYIVVDERQKTTISITNFK